MSKEKRDSPISRVELMTYVEHLSTNQLVWKLKSRPEIDRWAVIEHNRDVWTLEGLDKSYPIDSETGKRPINPETGQPFKVGDRKKIHDQGYVHLKRKMRLSQIEEMLDIPDQKYCVQPVRKTEKDVLMYLTHKANPEKTQYNDDEVISNFDWIEKRDGKKQIKIKLSDVYNRIDSGEITKNNYYEKLPTDFCVDNDVKLNKAFALYDKRHKHDEIQRTMIYIQPDKSELEQSGIGKSLIAEEFAKRLCEDIGLDDYAWLANGSDFMSTYRGEQVVIMDDRTFSQHYRDDFLNLYDPVNKGAMHSRFNDKRAEWLWCIVTSFEDFEDNIREIKNLNDDEDLTQMRRRFSYILKISRKKISLYKYDSIIQKHAFQADYANVVLFNAEDKQKSLDEDKNQNFQTAFENMLYESVKDYQSRHQSARDRLEAKIDRMTEDQISVISQYADQIIDADYREFDENSKDSEK